MFIYLFEFIFGVFILGCSAFRVCFETRKTISVHIRNNNNSNNKVKIEKGEESYKETI